MSHGLVALALSSPLLGCEGALSARSYGVYDTGATEDAGTTRSTDDAAIDPRDPRDATVGPREPSDAAVDPIDPPDAAVDPLDPPDAMAPAPDASVPTPSGTDSVDAIVADMREGPTAYARSNNEPSVIFSGNAAQAERLSPTYGSSIDNITSWCWVFSTPENAATHAAVQVRYSDVYVLRASTGTWEPISAGRPSGWRGDLHAATFEVQDEIVIDDEILEVHPGAPPRTDLVSYELWPTWSRPIDFWEDVRAVYATCQARVVALPDAPPGDLERAHYAGQVGFDLWRRAAGPFEPGVTQFDGSVGRMHALGTEWQSLHVISMRPRDPEWSKLPGYVGLGPAWTVINPYLDPPYTLTEEEIRANPPPLH